jgi:AcrR family transcriptional regulator
MATEATTPLDTTPKPGRRNRRFTAEERSADIIRVATTLIAERGYNGTSLQDVASGCGMTVPGLLHYYPAKDRLLIAVLENRDRVDLNQASIEDIQGYIPDARQRLDRLVRRNSRQPELVRLYTVLNTESFSPDHPAHTYFNERYRYSTALIGKMLEGHFPDPEYTAAEILGIMDGIQIQWLRFPEVFSLVDMWMPLADAVFARELPAPE